MKKLALLLLTAFPQVAIAQSESAPKTPVAEQPLEQPSDQEGKPRATELIADKLGLKFSVWSSKIRRRMISTRTPYGFSIGKVEDKMGIRCVPVVEVRLQNCRIGSDQLLGGEEGEGFKHAMQTLDLARPGVAAQGLGLAQGALEYAMVYGARREQFGKTVDSFQMVQKLLADMAIQVEAARQLVYTAAHAADTKAPNTTKLAAMCKTFATDTAMQVTTDAVQVFGGYGYMHDYPIEKYMRDAKITQIYEGTNQVQRVVVARNLMKETEELTKLLDSYIPREIQNDYADKSEAETQEFSPAKRK